MFKAPVSRSQHWRPYSPAALCSLRSAAHAQLVKIDGSSTVFPITEAVAEDFQKSTKGKVKVTVGISGTGGGFKKFCRGETDISNASRPILKKEMDDCKAARHQYIEMPVAYDALTVVVHPDNNWASEHDGCGAEEDVGAGRPGQGHELEAGQPRLARCSRSSCSARAPTPAPSITSPRRSPARRSPAAATSPPARTTTCWCRACRATSTRWATSASPTTWKTGTS